MVKQTCKITHVIIMMNYRQDILSLLCYSSKEDTVYSYKILRKLYDSSEWMVKI